MPVRTSMLQSTCIGIGSAGRSVGEVGSSGLQVVGRGRVAPRGHQSVRPSRVILTGRYAGAHLFQ